MELQEILSVAIGTLIVVVISHFAVFWVVRSLYPPQTVYVPSPPPAAPAAPPAAQPAFTSAPIVEQQQNVTIPTYETSLPAEAPREERKGPPPAESTSIRGDSGVASANTQRAL